MVLFKYKRIKLSFICAFLKKNYENGKLIKNITQIISKQTRLLYLSYC